ncbi:ATP-binding protein [Roseivivax sp. CAU 1761]
MDGQPLRAFQSPRLQRLLALIVLRTEAQNRSRLAFELWPSSTEAQARTNLRKLLHEFRRALPQVERFAEIGPDSVRWRATDASWVDALRFRDAIASGDLECAARIYRGDLLPACYDDWVLAEREGFRAEALALHRQLAEAAAVRGDHSAAIGYARAVGALDFADEAAVRLEVEAHLAQGDRTSALRAYRTFAEALRRELAVDPSAEIAALQGQIDAAFSERQCTPTARGEAASASNLVGRAPEWRALAKAWTSVKAGRAHLLVLTGEPGIGKSRLAQEFGSHLHGEGHALATARAYEAAGRLPWGPVIDLLRSASIAPRLRDLDPIWRSELARLVPELGDLEPPAREPVARRHLLFDAVSAAIAANEEPKLVILDDLQWCDVETIEFIGYLLSSRPRDPLLIVGTARWEELPDGHPLPRMIDALQADGAATVVALHPLDKASTAALAAGLREGDAIDPEAATRLWEETEGNPLFIVEAVKCGIPVEGGRAILTPTMRSVLRARLDQLTEGARKLAEMAAIFGRSFSARALQSVMGAEADLTDRLDELWRRGIIGGHGQSYDFSHDKLRDVTLEMIAPARRRKLHRMVAEALAQDHATDPATSAQLAAHYDQAGMVIQAIEAYRVAAARAVAMSGFDEAVALFRRALELLEELPARPERDALELDIRIALGSPLVALEGYGSAVSHRLYERALSLCCKLDRPVAPPVLRGLGLARLQGCRFDQSTKLARALIDHESGDHVAATEGRYLMGVSAFWQGDLKTSLRYLEAAIAHYDPARSEEHLARYAQDPKAVCLVRLGLARLWSGDPESAMSAARTAAEHAERIDHLMTSAYVVTYSAILASEAEDYSSLAARLEEADCIWSRFSDRYLNIALSALRGWLEVQEGRMAGIDKILCATVPSRVDGETLHLSLILYLLAQARVQRGEWREASAAAREALAWSEQCNQGYLVPELLRLQGEIAFELGERDTACAALHRAVNVASAQGARWLTLKALHSRVGRFPDADLRRQLAALADDIPSGHDLPAFRAARRFLRNAG